MGRPAASARLLATLCALSLAVLVFAAGAQAAEFQLLAGDAAIGDQFGYSVSIDGADAA